MAEQLLWVATLDNPAAAAERDLTSELELLRDDVHGLALHRELLSQAQHVADEFGTRGPGRRGRGAVQSGREALAHLRVGTAGGISSPKTARRYGWDLLAFSRCLTGQDLALDLP